MSEYSLVRVRGMDAEELAEALSYMNDDDRQSVYQYLENKGAYTIEIISEAIGDSKEYSPDVWYSTDTNEVVNLTAETGRNEKAEKSAERNVDKETDLLRSGFDKYSIYQLKDYPELEQFRFKGTEALKRMGIADNLVMIKPENYSMVYTGRLSELQKQPREAVLETVYQKFNTDRPKDFKGHSLSVSDIVVLHENGKNSAHFVDSFGFIELPDFMRGLEGIKEQSILQGIPEQDSLKSEIEQIEIKQTEPEQAAEIPEFENIDDEDEIIDLGEEREQAFAEMKKSLDRLAGNAETAKRVEVQKDVTADFKAKTNEMFHEISGMNPSEIEKIVKYHVEARLEEYGISAKMTDAAVAGSRCRGLEHEDSDLDVVVELSTNEREDVLFHVFNENGLYIGGIKVDINPITEQKTGSLETYLPQVEEYLERVREVRTKESVSIVDGYKELGETLYQKQSETEVTLTVAGCDEFHNLGELYRNIPTIDGAVAVWKQIVPERMSGIPAIGIHIHTSGTKAIEDVELDILSGNKIHLNVLDDIPDIKSNPQVMEVIVELIAKLPEMEIDGSMGEAMEAAVWRKRMSALAPAEQLAVELDRFAYHYDTDVYHDSTQSMTEHVVEIAESISQGDVSYLTEWLADVISEETELEERKRAEKLLEKLVEYNAPVKTLEVGEQNYYMATHVSNNGTEEKIQKEENKKGQGFPMARMSLKTRLAEKKMFISGQGKEHEEQENIKKNQREV